MRDSQRSKVYAAEKALPGYLTERRLETVPELQAYVDEVTRSEWFRWRFPRLGSARAMGGLVPVLVLDGRGRRSACASGRTISMPCFARSRMVVLHELAHVCILFDPSVRPGSYAAHGWEFCAIYLELVRQFFDQPMHDALVWSFRTHRVQFARPVAARRAPALAHA